MMGVGNQERRSKGGTSGINTIERGRPPTGPSHKSVPKFPKSKSQRSFHAQSTHQKQGHQRAEEDQYLGPPPQGLHVVSATLTLPRDDLFPWALEDPASLDIMRLKYKIWITFDKPHVLGIHSRTPSTLQEAIAAINWLIHDMRLTSEQDVARFLVQERMIPSDKRPVRVLIGHRPSVVGEAIQTADPVDEERIIDALWSEVGGDLSAKAESLMGLGKELYMSVNFGRLNVRRKEKGNPDEFTHQQFRALLKPYGCRGNASLGKSMPDGHIASAVLEFIMDPDRGLEYDATGLRSRYTLTLSTEVGDVIAAIKSTPSTQSAVSSIQAIDREDWSRLDWTVSSPDTLYDWNLEVKAHEKLKSVPTDLQDYIQSLKMEYPKNKVGGKLMLPRPSSKNLKPTTTKVLSSCMRSSAMITLGDGQHVVEIHMSRTWDQANFEQSPSTTWGIELYGRRWEEAINTVSPDGRKKYWGKDMTEVWPGAGTGLEDRFKNFLRCVLKVKGFLDRVATSTNEQR